MDFGFCLLQTPQLTAALHFSFPIWLGILLVVLGVLMCVTILLAVPGLMFLIFGAFMLLRRHHVVLSGSDGRTYVIRTRSAEFAAEVVDRIRTVVTQVVDKPSYVINIKAGTIEAGTLLDMSATSIAGSAGAAIVKGGMPGPVMTNGGGPDAFAQLRPTASIPATARYNGSASSQPSGYSSAGQAPAAGTIAISNAPGAVAVSGQMHGHIATHAHVAGEGLARDIDAIVALLEHNNVAHREQLAQMLRHIQQQAANGPAGVESARATWSSFAQYAFTYLTGVEGLLGLAERVQRAMFR